MKKRSHRIQQQTIEVAFTGLDNGVGRQDRIAEIFYSRIQPKMNLLFDDIANDGHLLSLDKLEIDCGVLPEKDWENEFVENTLRKLKDQLLTKQNNVTGEINNQIEETLLFFLEYGYLSWHMNIDSLKEGEQVIQLTPLFFQKLKNIVGRKKSNMQRFISNTSSSFREKILTGLGKGKPREWKMVESISQKIQETDKPGLNETVLKIFLEREVEDPTEFLVILFNNSSDTIKKEIKELINWKDVDINLKAIKLKENEIPAGKEPNEIYIRNAGLILLHPFIPRLFELGGLYKENDWLDESSQDTGVKVLEYLCTGKNEFAEIHFSLDKILCGLKPSDFVDDKEPLPQVLTNFCNNMISEVIGYWPQLKNTGTEAFRETFLQRNGKLNITDNGWLLQVEQKTVDVLLDSLQWGIGVVRLPWMKEIVYTEWR